MLCTTLIPSYKRSLLLIKAIESFRETAADPTCHEVIVRLSKADPDAHGLALLLPKEYENCHVIIGEQMNGYMDIASFYNEMVPLIKGEWVNIWDDDMTIEGEKWDEKLKEAPHRAAVVCENYKLGPSWYGMGSLDANCTGWFAHLATWLAAGGGFITFPPDTYMRKFSQQAGWGTHHLRGITLNHNWQRPTDGNR